ncbi:MAG: elongation factor P [Bacilli bacterium]|nr:elongation factor P [Bacilli bacterium]
MNITSVRPGTYFEDKGEIFVVLDNSLNKTAMRKMVVKIKVKNLRIGSITEITHNSGYDVNVIHIDKEKNEFLYANNDAFVFMNMKTFEQVEINQKLLMWEKNFLIPGMEIELIRYDKELLGVSLPPKIALKIIACDPSASVSDSVKNQMKNAVLETGLEIKVPRFINVGDVIYINTESGEYSERAKI